MILDPGFVLTLRPMKYPVFFEMYKATIKNTWTVEEVDFSHDVTDLKSKLTPAERHLIHRLVAFFATGDSIVSNNLVLNLYKHVNSPEARVYLSRQLFEEAVHVEFYLTLLDTYIPDPAEREQAEDGKNDLFHDASPCLLNKTCLRAPLFLCGATWLAMRAPAIAKNGIVIALRDGGQRLSGHQASTAHAAAPAANPVANVPQAMSTSVAGQVQPFSSASAVRSKVA